jgi:hypothetical protein
LHLWRQERRQAWYAQKCESTEQFGARIEDLVHLFALSVNPMSDMSEIEGAGSNMTGRPAGGDVSIELKSTIGEMHAKPTTGLQFAQLLSRRSHSQRLRPQDSRRFGFLRRQDGPTRPSDGALNDSYWRFHLPSSFGRIGSTLTQSKYSSARIGAFLVVRAEPLGNDPALLISAAYGARPMDVNRQGRQSREALMAARCP